MDVRRGKLPETVTRQLEVEITREEMLSVFTLFLKQKLKAADIRIEHLKGVGAESPTGTRLESMTLTGTEVVPIPWPQSTIVIDTVKKEVPPAEAGQ